MITVVLLYSGGICNVGERPGFPGSLLILNKKRKDEEEERKESQQVK